MTRCTVSMTCQALRRCRIAMTTRLYSSASSRTWSVTTTLVDGLGLDPQGGTGAGHAGADPDALAGAQHGGAGTAGKAADLLDGGDDAVRRVAVGEARGEQQPPVGAGLGGLDHRAGVAVELDRHDHAGQHHEVGHGEKRKVR